nr:hypothetical protein [uncultured Lichenicoccus sp.]
MRRTTLTAALWLLSVRSWAQDAALVQPRSFRVVLDNAKLRVLEYIARPGIGVCGSGLHSHPEHLTVVLTTATVRVTQDGKTMVTTAHAGDVFWSPPVTHETENVGSTTSRCLLIELKAKSAT